jgi:mannose-1-phosphate guanylyltransferase
VKAVVLVGGEGTRLRPLTFTTPKQMLPIVERPMIERVLEHLGRHGVDEAVLSLQYLPDAFKDAYPDNVAAGVRLSYATEPAPLDTAGAVRFAAEAAGIDDTFVVVNGDVLTDLDLGALLAFHRSHGAQGTVRLFPVDDPSRFGVVTTDDDGRVLEFIEKPPADAAPSNLINAGTYVFEPSFLDRVQLGERVSIERVTFPAMVTDGQLYAMSESSYWLDTGTPAAYLQAHVDLLSGRRPGPPCPGATLVADGLWCAEGARVDGEVRGPSLVGREAAVESGALVERSVLGAGSVVHRRAVVRDSVAMAGVVIEEGARVDGAILGRGARIGAECEVGRGSVIGYRVELDPGRRVQGRVPG